MEDSRMNVIGLMSVYDLLDLIENWDIEFIVDCGRTNKGDSVKIYTAIKPVDYTLLSGEGEGTTNYQWALGCGRKVADYLARFPVICAGMIAGTKLLSLLEVFTRCVSQIGGGKVEEHIDQPLMSYIVRRRVELGTQWEILKEENRVCQHLGSECFNFREWMPAMVHGYPIYPELQREIEKRLE